VLSSQYEYQPTISSVRIFNAQNVLINETMDHREGGRLFTQPIQLQQQALGKVELRLMVPTRADVLRHSIGNIGLSGFIHLLLWVFGMRLGATRTVAPPQKDSPKKELPTLTDIEPPKLPEPEQAPAVTLLHLAISDPKNLITHVNVEIVDELLSLFDQFIDRAAQLYGGQVETPFSPEGVLVRFQQSDDTEREFQAIAAATLFLQLVEEASDLRQQHHHFCLDTKAGILHAEQDDDSLPTITAALARMAPANRILSNKPRSSLVQHCYFEPAYRLAIGTSEDETLSVMLVESLAPEYQQLIRNQSQQILRAEDSLDETS
jgi:uncharacterized glyoxalase superfamily protein PhnB